MFDERAVTHPPESKEGEDIKNSKAGLMVSVDRLEVSVVVIRQYGPGSMGVSGEA